jgi:inner membrane transporter RhtA
MEALRSPSDHKAVMDASPSSQTRPASPALIGALADRVPPLGYFMVSAVFHYLGPSFAVLLFARIEVLGVAWLRIATAALVFGLSRRAWRFWFAATRAQRLTVLALGVVLAAMNGFFYVAIDRLPLGTVGAIEFIGPTALAAIGLRTARNLLALALAVAGVAILTDIRLAGEPLGYLFAFANAALFLLYILLGHRIAASGGAAGIGRLGAALGVALVAITPFGIGAAWPAFSDPILLLAGAGVGIASSVVPYICDQLAMARLTRAHFALLLSVLPAMASLIGLVVLRQVPSLAELLGIGLVVAGVALRRET